MMRPIFEAWLEPFRDLGGHHDQHPRHRRHGPSFLQCGRAAGFPVHPGSDGIRTRTHHSNMDVYDRLQAGDLMQAAAIMAGIVYHAAMRDEMLPRKPLPKPQPEHKPGGPTE